MGVPHVIIHLGFSMKSSPASLGIHDYGNPIWSLFLQHGSLVMSPFFTSPNQNRYMVNQVATIFGDVQYSQVMGQ